MPGHICAVYGHLKEEESYSMRPSLFPLPRKRKWCLVCWLLQSLQVRYKSTSSCKLLMNSTFDVIIIWCSLRICDLQRSDVSLYMVVGNTDTYPACLRTKASGARDVVGLLLQVEHMTLTLLCSHRFYRILLLEQLSLSVVVCKAILLQEII